MHHPTIILLTAYIANAVRLNSLFQMLDGFKSDFNLQGQLHVGKDYAIFLRKPQAHDKYLTYELYRTKNVDDVDSQPKLLAISKIPVSYIREQLRIFRDELYRTKYIDNNVVPGTQVKTLREWQIERALNSQNKALMVGEPSVLRTLVL
ncbi:uncharacterized protein LOC123689919 [Pieris rapae]|uniref:uncharacterized protein LOC123689919 n=1 Tax=Pieris rapae TaxID=64459 RepID=UPI001E27D6E0|nr:uncharacterized protein LOC123689919 [Pieris rapae]